MQIVPDHCLLDFLLLGIVCEMPTTVHVRPLDSKGITQSSGNQPLADKGGTAEKHPSWFPRMLICFCIVQMLMVTVIAVVLAIFLNAHVSIPLYQ